jgi:hypothetical protein
MPMANSRFLALSARHARTKYPTMKHGANTFLLHEAVYTFTFPVKVTAPCYFSFSDDSPISLPQLWLC